jgi:hypothetical protein
MNLPGRADPCYTRCAMKTLIFAAVAAFSITGIIHADPVSKETEAYLASLKFVLVDPQKTPVYTPLILTQPTPVVVPPPVIAPLPQPAVPVQGRSQGRSRPLNPTMTAQKFMRHYQPTEEEQLAAEMRRDRQQRLMDDQRRFQEQAEMQRRLHQLEQARIIEAQRRQMEEFRRQNHRFR